MSRMQKAGGGGRRHCLSGVSDLYRFVAVSKRKLQQERIVLTRVSWAQQQERTEVKFETIRSFQRSVRTETPGCPSESCWSCY